MRYFIAAILLSLALTATAQLKYDANWVFGRNCGMSFVDTANPMPFYATVAINESVIAISDSTGELLFYTGGVGPIYSPLISLFDGNNDQVAFSDTIKMSYNTSNGFSIIPLGGGKFLLLHLRLDQPSTCASFICFKLRYSIIEIQESDDVRILKSNILLSTNIVNPKIGVIKHANGRDWWIVTHQHPFDNSCTNVFQNYLVQADSIIGPIEYHLGYDLCDDEAGRGEITVSKDGSTIAMCYGRTGVIDMLSFDRCTGELYQIDTIKVPGLNPYGAAFSSNGELLYISVIRDISSTQGLYQLQLGPQKRFISIDTLLYVPNVTYFLGQLELAPNNKIYLSTLIQADLPFPENKYLGVINFPDSVGQACGFEQYGLAVGDSCYTKAGLPNFPNYNLEPLGPYRMSAGVDKVICTNDTSQHGVTIGSPVVAGITYQWISEEIDSADRSTAQIMVHPDSSTLYYIQITDSSYSGSCSNSYIDSVLVEVKECQLVGINEAPLTQINLYPNPATDQLYIKLPDNIPTAQLEFYSLLGAKLLQSPVHHQNPIDISQLPKGMYVYRVRVGNSVHNGKLLIE